MGCCSSAEGGASKGSALVVKGKDVQPMVKSAAPPPAVDPRKATMTDIEIETQDYYDSKDADTYYHTLWGGQDLHLGIYDTADEAIRPASDRTTERMMSKLSLTKDSAIVDLGAGYGGSSRLVAKEFGCKVTCYNLSEVENKRNVELCKEAGVAELITVTQGSFDTKLPFADKSVDCVWSQDAFLHSADRPQLLQEVCRILKDGGELIMTDPMQADAVDVSKLKAVFDRLPVSTLGSFKFYLATCTKMGLKCQSADVLTEHLKTHYSRVLDEVKAKEGELRQLGVREEYIDRQKTGLRNWVDAAGDGCLTWGIMHFRK